MIKKYDNSLNSDIKLTIEKIDDLEKEKKYILKLKGDHDICEVQNSKIKKEIEEIKKKLEKIREQNKLKNKMEQKKQSLKMKEINHNLTAKKIKERNEQFVKNEIDKYLEKNKNLLNASHTEEKLIPKKQSNKDRKIQKLNNCIIIQQKYSKKIWRCLTYLKIMMKINCRKFLHLSKMKRVLFVFYLKKN